MGNRPSPDPPLPPGSTIGIFGGGQLGRMLVSAAVELGFETHVFCQAPNEPAAKIAHTATFADFTDEEAVTAFAQTCDVVTYEFENVPIAAVDTASKIVPTHPSRDALLRAQDRMEEKGFVSSLGVRVAPFEQVDSLDDLKDALASIGTPSILKSRRLGYDGKGQFKFSDATQAADALKHIGNAPAVLEGFVNFSFECSIIAVRSIAGEICFYDAPANVHEGGILRTSTVPSSLDAQTQAQAREITRKMADALSYVGVIAVEFFCIDRDGNIELAVNEFAPRVHNSGHWTMDACQVSQFENHIRAVAGWPLGATDRHSDAVMTNLIGKDATSWAEHAAAPDTSVHLYGKNEMRAGRKMGHVTRLKPRTGSGTS